MVSMASLRVLLLLGHKEGGVYSEGTAALPDEDLSLGAQSRLPAA